MEKIVKIIPKKLTGTVCAPPSKSAAHRAILCAALSCGESLISNLSYSEDILATLSAAKSLGAKVHIDGDTVRIKGICKGKSLDGGLIDCNESGSTLRFIIPIALAIGGNFSVTGRGRLLQRPLDDYYRICDEKLISHKKEDNKITFCGKLTGGKYELSGNVSSQYITGLLFALPILESSSEIVITTPLESTGYVNMTIEMLSNFGIKIEVSDDLRHFYIPGNQTYKPFDYFVEGDYSQAAFYFIANELGNDIDIKGLLKDSTQGDKAILDVIDYMKNTKEERTVDVSQIPDLVPIISLYATQLEGVTNIIGAKRLRIKESDRLASVTQELTKLGAKIEEHEDSLIIYGKTALAGAQVYAHNDHRIAMTLAVASTVAMGCVEILGADSVKKSYQDFWDKFCELGGCVENGE